MSKQIKTWQERAFDELGSSTPPLEAWGCTGKDTDTATIMQRGDDLASDLRKALLQSKPTEPVNQCKLTECRGRSRCATCIACDNIGTPAQTEQPVNKMLPVEYQYHYPDGSWRCSNGDVINGVKPDCSRPLYAEPVNQVLLDALSEEQAERILLDMAEHVDTFGSDESTPGDISKECIRFILDRVAQPAKRDVTKEEHAILQGALLRSGKVVHPAKREPLTDAYIIELWKAIIFARAIEAENTWLSTRFGAVTKAATKGQQ